MGPAKMVILCGYDTVKDALINHGDKFVDRPKSNLFSKTTKDHGIVLANGENWKVMRRFTLSALRDYGMGKKTTEDKIIDEAESLVQRFRSYKGKPFNNLQNVNSAVANIIVAILLSHRFDYDDPTILRLVSLINENMRLFGSPLVRLANAFPFLLNLLPGAHKKIFANIREFHSFLEATFTKQRKELDVNDQRNIIDAFLVKQQELISFLTEKVQSEIEKVIGLAQPQVEHRKQMPYTEAVIHEIQRFGDIIPANVPRAASQDVTFRGYFIPKGTVVFPLLNSVLKDKTHFKKPDEFYPEHFLDSSGNLMKNEAFIPFSLGKRSCAGETLAKMELFLFFTTLLQNFTFQAPPGATLDLTPGPGTTNGPKPYEICAVPRK
ncbi:hypothetical protein GDO78_015445 [Eleutherodactylus coqui]|nr:hypothetical protein GDO78_015445 [Eleutherodactylus coqui]